MRIQTHCPKCGRKYLIDDRLLGRNANCKVCGEPFAIVADGDALESPVLPKEHADKDLSRSSTEAPLDQPFPPQRTLEPKPGSEKSIFGLVIAATVLFLIGNCFAYSHYWLQRKTAKKQIQHPNQKYGLNYFFLVSEAQRPSQGTIPEGVGIIQLLSEEMKLVKLWTWAADGFVRVFVTRVEGLLTISIVIGAAAVLVSLLLTALSLIALLRRRGAKPMFYLPLCAIGIGVVVITLSGVKYRSIIDRIDQDKKSVAVTSAWTFLQMDENERLPASISEVPENARDLFDKLYFAGGEAPDAVRNTRTEWLLLAPLDCHDSNCLYLAVVMYPVSDGYVHRVRIMPGSKINDMISRVR